MGRFATWELRQHQYFNVSDRISPELHNMLGFMMEVAVAMLLRSVPVLGVAEKQVLVYSDASWEADAGRLGWFIYDPRTESAQGYTMVVAEELRQEWCPRVTQITVCEAMCCVAAVLTSPGSFRGRDVL